MDVWMYLVLSVLASIPLDVLAQKKTCPVPTLKNGRVRIRGGGRMAYFRCKKKFRRVGHKLAVCLSSGTWSQQTPVCVGRGCPDLGSLPDVIVTEMYKGGILQFSCPEGMRREGPQKLMCDGTNWSEEPPKCLYGVSLGCDFEDAGLCGWSQDTNDDFDWTWTSGITPTSETGPKADHTTGKGHYVFMESSAPQKSGQVARIISPPYSPTPDPMCLDFFYHMKGPPKKNEVGDLDVYVRTGKDDNVKDKSVFHRDSYQGEDWIQAQVTLPVQKQVYKIVFAATRRESWTSDIALDDIKVLNCSEMAAITTPPSKDTTSDSVVIDKQPTPDTTPKSATSPSTTTTTTTTTPSTTTTTPTTTTPTTTTTTTTTTLPTTTMPTTQPTSPTSTTTTTTVPASTPTTTSPKISSSSTAVYTSTSSVVSTTQKGDTYMTSSTLESNDHSTKVMPSSTTSYFMREGQGSTRPGIPRDSTMEHFTDNPASSTPSSSSASSSSSSSSSSITTDVSGSGSTEVDSMTDSTEGKEPTDTRSASSSQGAGPGVSDYLPLIIGVSLGLAVGVAVVAVLAWMWTRNKRKQKALRVEEDQLNIIGSIEPSSYSYPLSGSEH